MPLAPSARLGSYEIIGPLGSGGMGEVYRARDLKLLREVAIKILPSAVANDPDRHARFVREARVLASLNHPNIAAIFGVEDSSGFAALVLELVEGPTLEDRIAAGPLAVPDALAIARQVADAIDAAHDRGIIHRDLKPANIKLTANGAVKVLDFGLARVVADDPSSTAVLHSPTVTAAATRDGIILGTAPYMSPEQARGQTVDHRTDVWAFGCVLYEMLTGRRAFGGATVTDAIVAVVEREPDFTALPAATPPPIRRLLRRALRKDPRERLHDIADARFEIDDALAAPGASELTAVAPPRSRRSAVAAGLAGAAASAVILIGGWFLYAAGRVQPPSFSRVIRFVSTPAHEFGPAISRDGKWVAFLSNARGPSDIWVKALTGGDPVNLTANQNVFVSEQSYISGLEISPDGGLVAFSGGPRGPGSGDTSTWVIPAPLGGTPRRFLPASFHGLRWSPDGTRTAFIRAGGSRGDSIWVGDADGQNGREVLKAQGGVHAHWVSWSRDNRWIYFNRQIQNFNTGPTEIFRVSADGGTPEPVVTTARRAGMAIATPDGNGLLYAANPDSVDLGLWWRELRTGTAHRLTSGIGEYTEPSLSADGRRLVAVVLDARQNLARIRVGGKAPATLEPITDGYTGDFDPVWSPDRQQLVFTSSRTGTQNLWRMTRDLTRPEPLTAGNALDLRPSFSRDGRQVAFISDRGGRVGVWAMAAENGTPRSVAPVVLLDGVSWSPDGQRLVAAVPGAEKPGLITIGVADGKIAPLATPEGASAPAWSPTDDLIAYLSLAGQANGTRLRFVTGDGRDRPDFVSPSEPSQFGNGIVSWSADGKRLAVAGLPGVTTGSIWIAALGAPPTWQKLIDLPAGVHVRGMTWSQDGGELIVGVMRTSGDIVLAERDR
jgi:eukaryotic-like serine/threonine-protein kinase